MTEEHIELQHLVRKATEGWFEHTAKDESIVERAQMDAILWCVGYLWAKGYGPAGAQLLAVVPKKYAEAAMEQQL